MVNLMDRAENRGSMMVLVAGYKAEMGDFLRMNPGLDSRFPHRWHLNGFSATEQLEILHLKLSEGGLYRLTHAACEALLRELKLSPRNARDLRELARRLKQRAAHTAFVQAGGGPLPKPPKKGSRRPCVVGVGEVADCLGGGGVPPAPPPRPPPAGHAYCRHRLHQGADAVPQDCMQQDKEYTHGHRAVCKACKAQQERERRARLRLRG